MSLEFWASNCPKKISQGERKSAQVTFNLLKLNFSIFLHNFCNVFFDKRIEKDFMATSIKSRVFLRKIRILNWKRMGKVKEKPLKILRKCCGLVAWERVENSAVF